MLCTFETKMTSLLEQSICQNSRCFACGSIVYAVEKKITTHHVYHNRCFRCRICKRNLTGYSLNEEGDDIYCENCYRKKQRGDCNSFEFIRAAAERAQYIHNRHHPDYQPSASYSRLGTSFRDVARHPSWTLRQLERQYLSHQINQEIDRTSQPLTISTSFSAPVNLSHFRRDPSMNKDEISSRLSPSSIIRTETTITPRLNLAGDEEKVQSMASPTSSSEFRLHKSSIDLSHITSPRFERKSAAIPEDNPIPANKFRFADLNIKSVYRRSSSANRLLTPLQVD